MHFLLRTVALPSRRRSAAGDRRRGYGADRDRPLARAALACALAACAGAFTACASNHVAEGAKDGGLPIRIQCVIYGSPGGSVGGSQRSAANAHGDQRFELIDQSRSSASDLYSKTRKLEDASTKVTTDEILKETITFFESKGFFDKAESGPAPSSGGGGILRAIEVETPDRFVHLTIQKGFTQPEMTRFMECQKAFFDIYNNTYQLQAVDRAPDWESQNPGAAKKKPNG
jgi:hypothetical protein